MEFRDFVNMYWNKKRRSGALWTAETVAEDAGMNIDEARAFFGYCEAHSDLSDSSLIALSPIIQRTPFGMRILDSSALTGDGDPLDRLVSQVTLRELIAALKG